MKTSFTQYIPWAVGLPSGRRPDFDGFRLDLHLIPPSFRPRLRKHHAMVACRGREWGAPASDIVASTDGRSMAISQIQNRSRGPSQEYLLLGIETKGER